MRVTTQNLRFTYPGSVEELAFPDLAVETAGRLLIAGNSGTGKSTLLHLLCGLLVSTGGSVLLGDTNLSSLSEPQRDRFRAGRVGIVFQRAWFVASLNVAENLQLSAQIAGIRDFNPHPLLASLSLQHRSKAQPAQLSAGEQQRFSLARALSSQPQLLLCDEPTASLDDTRTEAVANLLLRETTQRKATLIVVSHDARLKSHFENRVTL